MKKYYHNITQEKFNETEIVDLVELMNEGDLILWSESGNALLNKLTEVELEEIKSQVDEFYSRLE